LRQKTEKEELTCSDGDILGVAPRRRRRAIYLPGSFVDPSPASQ